MPDLETRRLGRTEIQARALGLGCAWFGSEKSSQKDTIEGVQKAIDLGINYLDTSPHYGDSELRLGPALAGGNREKVFLQTKSGTHPARCGDYSAAAIRWSVENSLKLLKTDYLDSVLIHDPGDIEAPLAPGAALDELLKMKDEGLIGHTGLGVRQHEFHKRAIETGNIDIVLSYLDYTLLSQTVAETTIPLAREHDVGVILASILGMGRLAGPEPSKERDPDAHTMWSWCRTRGVSIRHLAMQFCIQAKINGIVMYGPSNAQQVEEGYHDAVTPVPDELWDEFHAEFGIRPLV
ncbi:MAG: aldo/keto reductase [Planctomycetota bacterium]|jgi:aryl-alcohol dehydrogenase-like predicted oxidoreductase|nr:aldo/keto reductase [Planctomycetota bacterium]